MLLDKMKAKHFRWIFLAALLPLMVLGFVGGEPEVLGVSAEWSDDKYRFAGGTEPWALAYALLVIVVFLFFLRSDTGKQGEPLPGVFRRFVAFWIDFVFGMTMIAPIVGILPVMTEWRRTGAFQWTFERTTTAPGDGLLLGTGLAFVFIGLAIFYARPLMRQTPTPGSCVMGYRIIADEEGTLTARLWLLRVLLGFIAACAWPIAPFVSRDKRNGKFWLDKVFRTRAVKLR